MKNISINLIKRTVKCEVIGPRKLSRSATFGLCLGKLQVETTADELLVYLKKFFRGNKLIITERGKNYYHVMQKVKDDFPKIARIGYIFPTPSKEKLVH